MGQPQQEAVNSRQVSCQPFTLVALGFGLPLSSGEAPVALGIPQTAGRQRQMLLDLACCGSNASLWTGFADLLSSVTWYFPKNQFLQTYTAAWLGQPETQKPWQMPGFAWTSPERTEVLRGLTRRGCRRYMSFTGHEHIDMGI